MKGPEIPEHILAALREASEQEEKAGGQEVSGGQQEATEKEAPLVWSGVEVPVKKAETTSGKTVLGKDLLFCSSALMLFCSMINFFTFPMLLLSPQVPWMF